MMWKFDFSKFFDSTFDVRIESSFLRAIWTWPIARFNIWNFQTELTIKGNKTRFVPYKSWDLLDRKIGVHVTDVITFIRDTFPDLEDTILYHIFPHIFVHLPTVRILHYRFLDFKKLDGVIYKRHDLMSFFKDLW